jgi:uncharacterized integral membrane protein
VDPEAASVYPPAAYPPADYPATAHPSADYPAAAHPSARRAPLGLTRASATWIGVIAAAVLLIALLIFIGQNSHTITIHYLGARGHISLALALLIAAVAGTLLVAIPGTARIIQLRRAVKKIQQESGPN